MKVLMQCYSSYLIQELTTEKQRGRLNLWEKGDATKQAFDADGDASTKEESIYDFDSDESD
jgi:hypothetical protein